MIFPCADGERTTRMCHWSAKETSAAKRPRPSSSSRSSRRGTERPMNFCFLSGIHLGFVSLAHFFRRSTNGLDDVLITGAAAEIGRQNIKQVAVADIGFALEHAHCQHQKARRAEATLQAMVIHECLLHGMQLCAVRQSFDGADLLAIGLYGEHQTGAHRLTIHDDGARSANSMLAADVRAGLPAILTDRVG